MYDVLVVGGGIAGLRAALAAKDGGASVAVVTQSHPTRTYSVNVQDGINAAIATDDSPESHITDTVAAGLGLNMHPVVEAVCREAPDLVAELDRMGVPFNRDGTALKPVQIPGSSNARTAFVDDISGLAITHTLYEQAIGAELMIYNEWIATELVVEDGCCAGVVAMELATGNLETISAGAVILATGGPRRAYERNGGSLICSGSGIAAAYRAGVTLADMEFVQYYGAVLKGRQLALSPLLWAYGASLNGGSVKLDGSFETTVLEQRFPDTTHRVQALSGHALVGDEIPVEPAMTRLLGGVAVGLDGATSMPGLFAVGECAGTGFHGAAGLDGNYLLVSVSSGKRAGTTAARHAINAPRSEPSDSTLRQQLDMVSGALGRPGGAQVSSIRKELASLMHANAGMSRNDEGLNSTLNRIQAMKETYSGLGAGSQTKDYNFGLVQYLEVGSLLDVAETIVASALERTESRGVHVRTDYPQQDNAEPVRLQVTRAESGPVVTKQPVAQA